MKSTPSYLPANVNASQLHDWLISLILAREVDKLLNGEKTPESTDNNPA